MTALVPAHERFWSKVRVASHEECWEWQAATNTNGYGKIMVGGRGGKMMVASRMAYALSHGLNPLSLDPKVLVCHRCDNPLCVNPSHLFLGSPTDNSKDCRAKGRMPLGEQRPITKLTSVQVIEIRRLISTGQRKVTIAEQFRVSRAAIRMIADGRTWRHIPQEAR